MLCVCVLRAAPYCINMYLYNLHCWGLLVRWSCDACCPQASTSTHGARGVCRHKHNNWMTAATWTASHKVSPTPWIIRVWLVTFTPRLHCTGQLDQQYVMPLCSWPQDGHTSVWRWCQRREEGNIRWKMCSVYFSINGCTHQWNASESCELYPPRWQCYESFRTYVLHCIEGNFGGCKLWQIRMFLNQACAGHRPVRTWFLKINPVRIVGMRVCVCECACPRPRLLITSGVAWYRPHMIG